MAGGFDLGQLLAGGEFDPETIENLRNADREQMRQTLEVHLPADEVARILKRIDELLAATE